MLGVGVIDGNSFLESSNNSSGKYSIPECSSPKQKVWISRPRKDLYEYWDA